MNGEEKIELRADEGASSDRDGVLVKGGSLDPSAAILEDNDSIIAVKGGRVYNTN